MSILGIHLIYFSRYQFYEKNIFKSMGKNFRGLGGMELFLNRPEETKFVNTKRISYPNL